MTDSGVYTLYNDLQITKMRHNTIRLFYGLNTRTVFTKLIVHFVSSAKCHTSIIRDNPSINPE